MTITPTTPSSPPSPSPASPAGAAPGAEGAALRVVDATLRCMARWGLAKTTLDDVAREAGCSRATVYRMFPGGKDGLVREVAAVEMRRFFATLAGALEGAGTLEDLLVTGMTETARLVEGHDALQFLLAHELEAVLPHVAFRRKAAVFDAAGAFARPYLQRWLAPDQVGRAAEWVTRVLLSYVACPADGVDMTDAASVRHLVRTFVLPGLRPPVAPASAGAVDPLL